VRWSRKSVCRWWRIGPRSTAQRTRTRASRSHSDGGTITALIKPPARSQVDRENEHGEQEKPTSDPDFVGLMVGKAEEDTAAASAQGSDETASRRAVLPPRTHHRSSFHPLGSFRLPTNGFISESHMSAVSEGFDSSSAGLFAGQPRHERPRCSR